MDTALSLAEAKTYDAIFIDVKDPESSGFQICSRIQEVAANATAPLLFITENKSFNLEARVIMAGGQDIIVRPLNISELRLKALTFVLHFRLQNSAVPAA